MGATPSSTSSRAVSSTSMSSTTKYPIVGPNDIMSKKRHGSSDGPVQEELRWHVSRKKADNICNFNRHFAEPSGSAFKNQKYLDEFKNAKANGNTMKFYDSVTGVLLFEAPKSRSHDAFERESSRHGWPSFRDDEVDWENGHNLPDRNGNRYCINLVSVAGHLVEPKA
ncbi:hypothetical protein IV203_005285 [Nitzschia inconspicua]|uniref:Uncharacterized protein n=1 Tax=Nitzschia inconspicua TaxID=303405 RepID=A0A9K3KLY8_9STRA|nr:hypothetical protein IV203_005285 [Nitzschia inconspicua]